jgi:hypothetical protein
MSGWHHKILAREVLPVRGSESITNLAVSVCPIIFSQRPLYGVSFGFRKAIGRWIDEVGEYPERVSEIDVIAAVMIVSVPP